MIPDTVKITPELIAEHGLKADEYQGILKLIGREDLIGDPRYDTPDARMQCEAEVEEIITSWTMQRTKHEAMAQLSGVGVPAGAVLDTQDLVDEPSFYERGILQTMTHGERKMVMPTWPVRFNGVPTEVKSSTWPFVTTRSGRPSRSASRNCVPNPSISYEGSRRPAAIVASSKPPPGSCRYRVFDSR